jgi:hypothetical protein
MAILRRQLATELGMHIGAPFNRRNHPHTIVRQVLENLNAFIVHRICLFNAYRSAKYSNGTSSSGTSLVVTSATSGSGAFSTASMASASEV